MKKIALDESTIHSLHRMIKQVYDTFQRADKTIVESDFSWSSDIQLDYEHNPHNFYCFRFCQYSCFIHKHKSGIYSLECIGFVPKGISLYDDRFVKQNFTLYKNLYGRYSSFSEVKNAFSDVVNDITTFNVLELFPDGLL